MDGPTAPGRDGAAIAADRRARVGLALLVLAMHLPGLGRAELDHEEARRALPAGEALERGAWVEPTIWGRPYLAKPPFFYWVVAGSAGALDALGLDGSAAHLDGARAWHAARDADVDPLGADAPLEVLEPPAPVSPLAVRLPSVLAALATVLATFGFTRRSTGRTGALFAGGAVALAPNLISKATLGEIEATLLLLTFAGTAVAWRGLERGGVRPLIGGLLLGLAVLAKGPIAYAFGLLPLVVAALGLGRAHGEVPRSLRLRRLVPAALAALLLPGLWLALLVAGREGAESLTDTWSGELARGGPSGLGVYLDDRRRLLTGVLAGWLPASLVALLGWRAWRREPAGRFAALALAVGLGLLAVWPGVRARYALPLLPWAAVLGGIAVDAGRPAAVAAARGLARVGVTLGAATVAAGIGLALAGRFAPGSPSLEEPGAATIAAVVGALALALAAQWVARARWAGLSTGGTLVLAAVALLGARVVERVWIAPLEAHEHGRAASAARLVAALDGAREPWAIGHWGAFNLLYYVPRRLEWFPGPDTVAPGTTVLLAAGREPVPGAREAGWEPLLEHLEDGSARLAGRPLPADRVGELRDLSLWRAPEDP